MGLLLFLLSLPASAAIHLSFHATNPTLREVVVVYQTTIVPVALDAEGRGSVEIKDLEAVHAQLFYGQAAKQFFMEDGDSLSFTWDGADFAQTLQQEGAKARIFRYLNTVTQTAPDVQEYARSFADYKKLVDAKEAEAMKLMKAWKFERLSPCFAVIEAGRIHYGYASNLMMYAAAHPLVTQQPWTPDADYKANVRENAAEHVALRNLKEYREYMKEAARLLDDAFPNGASFYDRTLRQMGWLADHIENDTLRETLVNTMAIEYVDQQGVDSIAELRNLQATYVTLPALNAAFDRALAAWDKTAVGRPSPEIKGEDLKGNAVRIADFRGKYVYIDLWATWCAPCRGQFPHLKRLEEEFRDAPIVFLGLSTDEDKEAWRKMAPTLSGTQVYIGPGTEFARDYKISGIPHFILLDPQGRIVNASMTRPSDDETATLLRQLLGK